MSKKNNNSELQQKRLLLSSRKRGLVVFAISLLLILPCLFIGLRVSKAYYSIDLPRPRTTDELMEHMYDCVLVRGVDVGDYSEFNSYLNQLNAQEITVDELYLYYFGRADDEAGGSGLDQETFLDRTYRCMSFHEPDQSDFEEWDGLFEYYTHEEVLGFFQFDYGYNNIIEPAFSAMGPYEAVFESDRDGNPEIYNYVRLAHGYNIYSYENLTNNAASDGKPSLRPDRGRIAFESNRDSNWEIYSMRFDGTNVTRLTNNGAADRSPSWSPDGTKIVFFSDRDSGNREIYIMNANGSSQTRLTTDTYGWEDRDPKWSPDGTKILFVTDRDGDKEIFVMNSDGSGSPTQLTTNGVTDDDPDWSPDGTQIAFRSKRDEATGEIYIMDANGDNVTRLTENDENDAGPNWDLYGGTIIFESKRNTHDNFELFKMWPDGQYQGRISEEDNDYNDSRGDW